MRSISRFCRFAFLFAHVHRRLKLVQGIEHLSYDRRLTNLGIMHLSSSRIRSDLVETFKITNDMVNKYGMYDISKVFEFHDGGRRGYAKN